MTATHVETLCLRKMPWQVFVHALDFSVRESASGHYLASLAGYS
jgi:hypothetical protein